MMPRQRRKLGCRDFYAMEEEKLVKMQGDIIF